VISYIVTYTAHAVGWACLRRMGFLYAQAGELSYWYRCPPPDSVTPATAGPPVVLLHGIGLGAKQRSFLFLECLGMLKND
jgi:hypothetical protein